MPSLEEIRAHAQLIIEQCDALLEPVPYYQACTDRIVRPKPTVPTLGPAGFTFADPSYGSRMLRVTDGVAHPGRSYDTPSNTHVAAWSADGALFYVWGPTGPQIYQFDREVFTATPIATPYSQCEPTFSRTNTRLFYGAGGLSARVIKAYDLALGTESVVLDLDTLGFSLVEPRTYVGGLMEAAGIVVAFYGGQGQGGHYLVTAVLPDGTLKQLNTVTRLGFHLHSMAFDLSGRYVALYPNNADPCQVVFWDLQTDTTHEEHVSMWGHDALGFGEQTNMCPVDGTPWDARQWVIRSLDAIDQPENLIIDLPTPQEVYSADHQSWNHAKPNERVPVISSTYRPNGSTANWGVWIDELLAVETNGSGVVYRFAHHRHQMPDGRWSQPIAHVSPRGSEVIITTNWEKQLGLDTNEGGHRNDVFVVELK